ncbi:MAG: type II secretion system inner membrane protein GspF [Thiohalomonadaceae bacterium]
MSAFEYSALDAQGRTRKGVLEADTARQIRQQLRDQGLTPLQVEEVAQRESRQRQGGISLRRGISASDLALLTRQLATLVSAALPLEECLATVARQSELPRLKSMIMAVRARVTEGHSLAEGLGLFPQVFHELYRSTVAAGEQSGRLEVVLERLADYTERHQQMQQKIMLALFYPVILTLVAVAVIIALLTYVVPEVIRVFDNIDQELPLLTLGLIAVSDFLRDYGLWLLILLGAVSVGIHYLLRLPTWRARWHRQLLRLPVLGRLNRGHNTARFARTFSILNASGVPVLEAMRIAAQVVTNLPMREGIEQAAHRVREGSPIARALEQSGHFPPMMVHLIASGEASGRLENMLSRAADNQEREQESQIALIMGMFEPLLILSMGGVVLVIVLAILLPIFDLNQLVA